MTTLEKPAASLRRILARWSKEGASEIEPDELDPEPKALFLQIQLTGLTFEQAFDGVHGTILMFSGRGMSKSAFQVILNNRKIRWIAFDTSSARKMKLMDIGFDSGGGLEWRIMREDFKALNEKLPVRKLLFTELSVGC